VTFDGELCIEKSSFVASIAPRGNVLSYHLHHNKSLLISFILIFDNEKGKFHNVRPCIKIPMLNSVHVVQEISSSNCNHIPHRIVSHAHKINVVVSVHKISCYVV